MHKRNLNVLKIESTSALFLDRDGVINRRIVGGYVMNPSQLVILPGVLDALRILSGLFNYVFIATNQQGVGKGLMSQGDLDRVHESLMEIVKSAQGRIDKIYFSPFLESENNPMRKPGIGMALQAKKDFPDIDLSKSFMVGDSVHDLLFGRNAGMRTIFIRANPFIWPGRLADESYRDLLRFAKSLSKS